MASAKSKTKAAKTVTKKSPLRKAAAATKAAPVSKGKPAKKPARSASEQKFLSDVLARGEAAVPLPSGELPPGATHEICGPETPGPNSGPTRPAQAKLPQIKPVQIKRRRFSAF